MMLDDVVGALVDVVPAVVAFPAVLVAVAAAAFDVDG